MKDPAAARQRRGYDFFNYGVNCGIRLQRDGDKLHVILELSGAVRLKRKLYGTVIRLKNRKMQLRIKIIAEQNCSGQI